MTEQPNPDQTDFTFDASKVTLMAAEPVAPSIAIRQTNGQPLVTINPDGRLEYGPGYEPDEAARLFWDAIQHFAPDPKIGRAHV